MKDSFKKSPKAFMETVARLPTRHLGRNIEHAGACRHLQPTAGGFTEGALAGFQPASPQLCLLLAPCPAELCLLPAHLPSTPAPAKTSSG